MTIKEKNPQDGEAFKIVRYLSNRYKNEYMYSLGSEYIRAKSQLDYTISISKGYMLISTLQILLVSLCSSGIFYLIFTKRKKDIAVSIMLGSTLKRQVFEMISKILLVVFLGLSSGFVYFYLSNGNEMIIKTDTIIVLLLPGVVTTVISVSLTLKDMYKIYPVEILQKTR